MKTVTIGALSIANNLPFTLIAGPCQIESEAHAMEGNFQQPRHRHHL